MVRISGRFVIRVAELYTDFNRAIMEYIDNSIDSAESYFNKGLNKYNKDIFIKVNIDEVKKSIIVEDNCKGIKDLNKLEEIGNSEKKADFTTNGQFGFGIYSFMAGCDILEFYSKYEEGKNGGYYLKIPKKAFEKDNLEEVEIGKAIREKNVSQGTRVILSKFNRDVWKSFDEKEIKKNISRHFEVLLKRKNLFIEVNGEKIEPYNYTKIEGQDLKYKIDEILGKSKKFNFNNPINIYLKMCEKQEVKRPPVFFVKGRKINEVKSIRGFKSFYGGKNILWGHSQITGYIDLKDNFEPTIKRDDFKEIRGEKFKAFNQRMNELEKLIYEEFITKKNEEKKSKTLSDLASKISKLLKKMAKKDALSLQSENLSKEGEGKGYLEEDGHGANSGGGKKRSNEGGGLNEGDGIGANLDKEGTDIFKNGKPKSRSGINVEFTDEDLVQKKDGKTYIKSKLIEGTDKSKTIRIYKKHKEFNLRFKSSKKGEPKITEKLINYIACEIAIHYQDEFYKKHKKIPKEYKKEVFEEITDLIYKLEGELNPLIGEGGKTLNKV